MSNLSFSVQRLFGRVRHFTFLQLLTCVLFLPLLGGSAQAFVQDEAADATLTQYDDPWLGQAVLSLAVEGSNRYSEERLLAALGVRSGDAYSKAKVERGIEYLWTLFQVRAELWGRLSSEGLDLLLRVVEMPSDLEPRFIGYDEVALEEILEWAQLEDRKELYLHQVPRVTGRLLDGYRREGFHFAEVEAIIREPKEGDDPDAPGDVIFEIIEGPVVNVTALVVNGNTSLPETGMLFWKDGLQHLSQVETSGPSLFDWNGSEYVEETLRSDLVAMRTVYREQGFLNAIVELDQAEFTENRAWVTLHVIVDEGPRFKVTDVNIEGFQLSPHPRGNAYRSQENPTDLLFPLEQLSEGLELKAGGFYEQSSISSDRYTLRQFYGAEGYIEHRSLGDELSWKWLTPRLEFDIEKAEVKVTYRIAQGREIRIREVTVNGATHTRDYVIRREISVEPGELADMAKIISSVRRLTRTGYFTDEQDPLNHRDPYFAFKTTPQDGWVDIDFIVEEGRVVDLGIQGGVSSNTGLFGRLSLSMNNFDLFDPPKNFWSTFGEVYRKEAFHGGGQRLTIQVSPGAEIDSSSIIYVEPDIFGLQRERWSMTTEASIQERRFEFYDGRRKTLRFSFGRQLGFDSGFSVGMNFRELDVDRLPTEILSDPGLFSLQQQIGVSQLHALTFGLNTRTTDAATNPKSGRLVNWRNEVALTELGSDWEMYTSKLSWDEYIRVGNEDVEVPSGFRISGGLGVVLPFGDTEVVPYSERLFLGGFNSLRGYRFRGVGPNSNGEHAIGGESMARLSVEYRYPLSTQTQPGSLRQIEMFRVHFFADAGVLGPDAGTLDWGETRAAAGFGFALLYPVPLAFNFAWPIEDHFGDNEQVFSFNIAIR